MTVAGSSEERSLRLRQLNDLHNSLLNTAKETFCPAIRWAMDQLGCPDAAAKPQTHRQANPKCRGRVREGACEICGWEEDSDE